MAGSGMLTLEELREIQPYQTENTPNQYIFYFPTVDGLSSHIIKSLLFRLENVNKTSYIVLGDSTVVTKRDIESGVFVDSDEGESRSTVLSERYGGSFRTTVIDETTVRQEYTYMGALSTTFIISTSGEKVYTESQFSNLVGRTEGTGGSRDVDLFMIEAFFNGENAILRTRIGSGGVMQGSRDKTIVRNSGVALSEQYVRNSMLGQMVFNLVNNIVTEGMEFNYSRIHGKIKKGEIKKEYLKRRERDSLYSRINIKGLYLLTKEADELDKLFLEFEREKGRYVSSQVDKFFSTSQGEAMKGYAKLVNENLKNKIATSNQEELEELKLLGELIKRISRDIGSTGGTLTKYQLYMKLVTYTEFRIGSVFGGI